MKVLLGAIFSVFALLTCALAGESNRVVTEHAESIFVTETSAAVPGETLWLAFHQELESGWHVYWKNPGDSGLPLEINWTLPDGFEAGETIYPTPERIPVGPLANFGHHGAPVFLIPIQIEDTVEASDAVLSAQATWLICEEICVPEDGAFELKIPVRKSAEKVGAFSDLFATARQAMPKPLPGGARYKAASDRLYIEFTAPASFEGRDVLFFPEMEGLIEPAAPQINMLENGVMQISIQPGFSYDAKSIDDLKGVIALEGGHGTGWSLTAVRDAALTPFAKSTMATETSQKSASLGVLLIAAFLGGVLLNIMPCVFPIIFIKAASLMKSVQTGRAQAVRRDGIFYTVGVVSSFALLGGCYYCCAQAANN